MLAFLKKSVRLIHQTVLQKTDCFAVNWAMFSHVLECFVESLNALYDVVSSVWKKNPMKEDLLSPPSFGRFRDNEYVFLYNQTTTVLSSYFRSVPRAIYEWLQSSNFDAEYLASRYLTSGFDEGMDIHFELIFKLFN